MSIKRQPRRVRETSKQPPTLLRVLDEAVFPTLASWNGSDLLLAQPTYHEFLQHNMPLTVGVSTSPRPHPGRRVAVRGAGRYRESARPTAHWTKVGLITAVVPMLIFPVKGQVDFRLSDDSVHLQRGHFYLLPPGVPRIVGDDSHIEAPRGEDEQCDLFWLRPREGALECWICHSHGKRHESASDNRLVYIHHSEALSYFTTILQESEERCAGWGEVCKSLLTVILTVVRRELVAEAFYGYQCAVRPPAEVTPVRDVITSAQKYIQDHLHEPLTINDVARVCYISRTQFTERFRHQARQSFNEYLTECRIECAKSLLSETD